MLDICLLFAPQIYSAPFSLWDIDLIEQQANYLVFLALALTFGQHSTWSREREGGQAFVPSNPLVQLAQALSLSWRLFPYRSPPPFPHRFNSLGAVDFWQPVLPRYLTHPGLFIYAIDFCLGCPTCCTQVCSGETEYREIFPMKCFSVRDKDFKARTALREISCLGCPWFLIIPKCREF